MNRRSIPILLALALVVALPAFASPDGGALFKTKCALCHGPDGAGQTPMGKSQKLRDLRSDAVQKQTDLELTKVIAGGKGKMQGYAKQLSSADIEALIAHIRTLKGGK